MNTKSFNKYFTALTSQEKYDEIIECYSKMESLKIRKNEGIYVNTMTAYAQKNNL